MNTSASVSGNKTQLQESSQDKNTKNKTINAEDTFVTIQTKDGKSSQKIPFYQFLEKIVGAKFESNIQIDASAFLCPDAAVSQPDGESIDLASESESESANVIPTCSIETDPKKAVVAKDVAEQNDVKPRGRGRPRKGKSKEGVGNEEPDNAQPSKLLKRSKDNNLTSLQLQHSSTQNLNVTQSPRRSRRTPARNSKFKEDFVDSSTLWSKGSSSWNTQLMTLALAAERHETKPNKHSYLHRKRNATLNGKTQPPEATEVKAVDNKCLADKSVSDEGVSNEQTDLENVLNDEPGNFPDNDYEPSGQILKKPWKAALNFVVSKTQGGLSGKAPVSESDKSDEICKALYYVIMEPKLDASGHGLLVQKTRHGIDFNEANISGNTPSLEMNPFPKSYPQDRYFACDFCECVFPNFSSWLQHAKNIHDKSMKLLENSQTLQKEIHQCPLCDERFPFQFMLDIHMEKNQHDENSSYGCTSCNSYFSNPKDRDEHWLLVHSDQICSHCGKLFTDAVSFRRHVKNECTMKDTCPPNHDHDVDTFTLEMKEDDICESLQVTVQDQFPHDLKSAHVEKITCDLCSSKFSTFSGLWHHKLEIHQQFFPSGFKEKLLERLEKNESMLKSTISLERTFSKEYKKNKYFVIMQPKWSQSKPQLKVSIEDKEFRFAVTNDKHIDESMETDARDKIHQTLSSDDHGSRIQKRTKFECSHCGEFFLLASEYREHCSQVHGECFEIVRYLGAFQCSQCSDTFPCQFMLNEHVKHHDGKKSLPCTLCGLSFHRIQERRDHWKKSHPGVGCPNCGKMYASIKYLQKHISLNCQDHYLASKKLTDLQKKQLSDIRKEDTEKKVEKKILKCHLCPKICSSIHCWRRHMSENHENDGFSKLSNTCIICSKVIYGYKALEKHLLQEHAEESGLPIEEENTIVSEALKRSKMDIIDYRNAGKDYSNIFQDEEGLFHCPECPKTHPDLKALTIHIKTHVNMQLECSVCKKTYKNPTLLKQHVMRHRTKAVYNCNTCGKKFVTLQKLNKHNKVHHSKENYVCELCGMSFTLNDYLLKHKRCHTDKRPHSCSVCGKTFRTKPELRIHVLIHTQETPYICEHCGRGFKQKGNWRIHLAQHTGHKPYQCNQCELSFALPSHLKRHLLTHNQRVNYRCIWCDKECTQRKHMQMHVTRVHKEDFFQYEEQMKLETSVPIAPSQIKMYNRRLGKAGQVRKAYRTRAKKCNTTSQDIMKGVIKGEKMDEESSLSSENLAMETIIEPMVETVTTDHSLTNQDIPQDSSLQILVSGDHQSYAKHDVTGELIGDDPSNVEIVMGDNHEINIIINNSDPGMSSDLAVQESLDESAAGAVTLPHFVEHSAQLHGSLQQAVNVLVNGSKGINGEEAMALDIESLGQGNDTYAIVYPS